LTSFLSFLIDWHFVELFGRFGNGFEGKERNKSQRERELIDQIIPE
jgi:hypothetical protein